MEERRAALSKTLAQVGNIKRPGKILCGNVLEQLFNEAGVQPETMVDKGLQFTRRAFGNTAYYFVVNTTAEKFSDWVSLGTTGASVILFDPMNKKSGIAKYKKHGTDSTSVYLQLSPGESCIIEVADRPVKGNKYVYYKNNGSATEIKGTWEIEFRNTTKKVDHLGSWTDLPDEAAKSYSGSAKYSIIFNKPADKADSWLLDLGKVNETAEIILNGKTINTLIGPIFQMIIPDSLLQKTNKLEIIVSNLMANRIAYMDRNNLPWKIFYNINMPARLKENVKNGLFDASGWKPLPSGLSGPVTITPILAEN